MRRLRVVFLPSVFVFLGTPVNADPSPATDHIKEKLSTLLISAAEGDAGAATRTLTNQLIVEKVNLEAEKVKSHLLQGTGFTHIDISIAGDAFGLDSGTKTKSEVVSTYRLHETEDTFIFNQTSLINFDNRNTVNLGLGLRKLQADEKVITGVNIFFDRELDSGHSRSGVGLELLTSLIESRYNRYNAISGTRTVDGINESALSGADFTLTGNLPYLYSSNIYYRRSKWNDAGTYSIKTNEWGSKFEVIPNLTLGVASQQKDSNKRSTKFSLSYSIQLGASNSLAKTKQTGDWDTSMTSVRTKLYQPVQRENRIMKKALKLGVTVSGY